MKWADSPAAAALLELLESEPWDRGEARLNFGLTAPRALCDHRVTLPPALGSAVRPCGRASSGNHKEVSPWLQP